jgi:penicillin-binding protein 1C
VSSGTAPLPTPSDLAGNRAGSAVRRAGPASMPEPLESDKTVRIIFPPDNIRLEAPRHQGSDARSSVGLRASGGIPPLTWFIDGAPIEQSGFRRGAAWVPRGPGLARISVIDALGAADSVAVWVEDPPQQ